MNTFHAKTGRSMGRLPWFVAVLLCGLVPIISAADYQMTVNVSASTGAIRYSASGFLYGLGDEGVPTDNMLIPLNPQVTAQKAPDGLQHPNGDALTIAPLFHRAGGRSIQIYMQDVYEHWPYDNFGLNDFLNKIDAMVPKVTASPYHDMFVYVPFNEPNGNWYPSVLDYGSSAGDAARATFFADWATVFNRIRSLDPSAKIAGPNLTHYVGQFHQDFMAYAKANNVVPDEFTWHELNDGFFSGWYDHYNHYRGIETNLGISPRPIVINEYARSSGDLGVPGNLVQWMARFENSKVDACLAYWTTAGSLNDLITENNKATGAWWLYKWYGELTGHTIQVNPPTQNSPLQGIAAVDTGKKQVRVLLGGALNSTDVFSTDLVITGLSGFGSSVHAVVWGTDNTSTIPTGSPYFVQEGDYSLSGGQITISIERMKALSAYHVIITPDTDRTSASNTYRYEAEYAKIGGSAAITYGSNNGYSGTYFVEGYGASDNASTNFVVTAPRNGYYNVALRYSAGPFGTAPVNRSLRVDLNGKTLTDLALPGTSDWNTWNTVTTNIFLTAGINRIDFRAYASDERDAVNLDYIELSPAAGTVAAYEAEDSSNTLLGAASVASEEQASGGQFVGFIGNGSGNTLQFNNVTVGQTGLYRMVVTYANAEVVGTHQYNNNIVDRYGYVSVNGGTASRQVFRNTLEWDNFRTTVIDVNLNAGSNTIEFSNSSAYAPDIDKISVAAAIGPAAAAGSFFDPDLNYRIVSRHSGKFLEIANASTADGGDAVQWTDNGEWCQRWQIIDTGNGYFHIINRNSGLLLEVLNGSLDNAADIVQGTEDFGTHQQWSLVDIGGGYFKIVNRNSGKLMDIYGASTQDGGDAVQWPDNNGANQQWLLAP